VGLALGHVRLVLVLHLKGWSLRVRRAGITADVAKRGGLRHGLLPSLRVRLPTGGSRTVLLVLGFDHCLVGADDDTDVQGVG
jgi:hypothetical protein